MVKPDLLDGGQIGEEMRGDGAREVVGGQKESLERREFVEVRDWPVEAVVVKADEAKGGEVEESVDVDLARESQAREA